MPLMGARMFCRACCYELTGLNKAPGAAGESSGGTAPGGAFRCPECGGGYTPDNPKTWQPFPRSPTMQFVFGRGGAWFCAAVITIAAFWQTWLPRPDAVNWTLPSAMRSWSMWRWFGMRFGYDVDRLKRPSISVWYLADAAVVVRGHDDTGALRWEARPLGKGRARITLLQPGCEHREILWALFQCQPWPEEPFRFVRPRRRTSAGTGTLEGTWQELIPSIGTHFGLVFQPLWRGEHQTTVLAIDPVSNRAIRATLDEAAELGSDPRAFTAPTGAIIVPP